MINHYESIPYALKPTDSTGRFPWFLNHQNGWCDPRLGSDAAIRSWLCLGHPVVKPPVGPPLVIGVGWKWNKGKNIALKSCSMGIYQETWKSSMAICWFTWGLLLEEIRLLRVPAVFFCMKIRLKNAEIFPWQLAWLYLDFCCINPITVLRIVSRIDSEKS